MNLTFFSSTFYVLASCYVCKAKKKKNVSKPLHDKRHCTRLIEILFSRWPQTSSIHGLGYMNFAWNFVIAINANRIRIISRIKSVPLPSPPRDNLSDFETILWFFPTARAQSRFDAISRQEVLLSFLAEILINSSLSLNIWTAREYNVIMLSNNYFGELFGNAVAHKYDPFLIFIHQPIARYAINAVFYLLYDYYRTALNNATESSAVKLKTPLQKNKQILFRERNGFRRPICIVKCISRV